MEQARDEHQTYQATSVRFRRAGPTDRSALITLCAAYRKADSQPPATEAVSAALDLALEGDPLIHVFMIELLEESEDAGEHAAMIVGYIALSMGFSIEAGGRDAFIDELYLEPAVQGRGLGKRALEFAAFTCRELGARRIRLEVERKNPRAHALYQRLGFREHERRIMYKSLAT